MGAKGGRNAGMAVVQGPASQPIHLPVLGLPAAGQKLVHQQLQLCGRRMAARHERHGKLGHQLGLSLAARAGPSHQRRRF